ncbi:MAG: hypothetical protein HFH73_10545 [Lachnospiraceae bacterium]|nr:hypothetical protein [Lachnospiraceae bacterium]
MSLINLMLGAKGILSPTSVTFCEISEKQNEFVENTSKKDNRTIRFYIEKTMKLDGISNELYDVMYTFKR